MENRTQRVFLTGLVLLFPLAALAEDEGTGRPLIEPEVEPQPVDEALIDTENFEVGGFAGVIHIEDFESSFLWGARLAYHLSESLFLESNVGFAEAGDTSFERLAGNVELLSDEDRDFTFYNLNLGYKVLPGEAYLAEGLAFNTHFYLVAGAGATDFAGDTRFTLNFGGGYQMLLTDSLAIDLTVREHVFELDVLGEEKTTFNPQVSLGFSAFF